MGLREWWDRLTGGDKVERKEEAMQATASEEPPPMEDYQGMKDDRAVEERYPGTERMGPGEE
jgi:hypothetical protein